MQAVPKKYISISIKPIWRAEVLVIVMVISREKNRFWYQLFVFVGINDDNVPKGWEKVTCAAVICSNRVTLLLSIIYTISKAKKTGVHVRTNGWWWKPGHFWPTHKKCRHKEVWHLAWLPQSEPEPDGYSQYDFVSLLCYCIITYKGYIKGILQ